MSRTPILPFLGVFDADPAEPGSVVVAWPAGTREYPGLRWRWARIRDVAAPADFRPFESGRLIKLQDFGVRAALSPKRRELILTPVGASRACRADLTPLPWLNRRSTSVPIAAAMWPHIAAAARRANAALSL